MHNSIGCQIMLMLLAVAALKEDRGIPVKGRGLWPFSKMRKRYANCTDMRSKRIRTPLDIHADNY